ncbi:MAG: DUF2283 domain-containing protein [Thermomicrobiales bacterium]
MLYNSATMRLELDTEAKALYLYLRTGRIASTIAFADSVFLDVDKHQTPLGIEFLDLDAFAAFFAGPQNIVTLPPRLAVRSLNRGTQWEIVLAV